MMDQPRATQAESNLSIDQVITSLRQTRDTLLSAFLSEIELLAFAEEHFGTIALSPIKVEFLKRDFNDLRKQSLDLAFYAALIRECVNGAAIPSNHSLFIIEIYAIFKKYGLTPPPEANHSPTHLS